MVHLCVNNPLRCCAPPAPVAPFLWPHLWTLSWSLAVVFFIPLPPLITRRKLSMKSVKWDAASGLNRRAAICSNSPALKVLTVCFRRPYVTINLRLGLAMLKNEKADCSCSHSQTTARPAGHSRPLLPSRRRGCTTLEKFFFNWFCN